jgi:transposase InsO family protein
LDSALTHAEARADLFQYIEGFYDRRSRHPAVGYLTPELMAATVPAADLTS